MVGGKDECGGYANWMGMSVLLQSARTRECDVRVVGGGFLTASLS